MRGIAIREELTDEWQKRGVKQQKEYEILTMDDFELIFTMLGERVTTEISRQEKPDTFSRNKTVAKRGGNVAGKAKTETEKEIGRSIVSKENYLQTPESQRRLKTKN